MKPDNWEPPFCADEHDDLQCPKCEEFGVMVREQETYVDGNEYEAYCGECHAALNVYASVDIAFSCPELVDEKLRTEAAKPEGGE